MDEDKLMEVGEYYQELNDLLGINFPLLKIYRSKGLPVHLIKKQHFSCLKHIDDIPDIIKNPDYIGINPNEEENTIELIKKLNHHILIGIKLNIDGDYFYVSTIHDVQESKIKRRLYSGRIKRKN